MTRHQDAQQPMTPEEFLALTVDIPHRDKPMTVRDVCHAFYAWGRNDQTDIDSGREPFGASEYFSWASIPIAELRAEFAKEMAK